MSENTMTATVMQPIDLDPNCDEPVVEMQKYLIFVSDNMKMGVNADYVVEIINNHTITYLPMMPEFVRGIINLRGQIIPIIDIRIRLGKESGGQCLVIVLNIDGNQVGVLVDDVDQMIDVAKESIHPMPTHSTQQLASGMCSLPDGSGTMMVLDCDQLMHHE